MSRFSRRDLGRVFDEIPDLYDRVRPGYPSEMTEDLAAMTGLSHGATILEVGCGTGKATQQLAGLGHDITAVEPGASLAEVARERVAAFPNVEIEISTFEDWDPRQRHFDLLVAAASWHWVDPSVGWRRAHDVLNPSGWMAILGNVVVRRADEPELYAETADLHQRYAPESDDWGHPPTEAEVRATSTGWGPGNEDTRGFFGPTTLRWYPAVQWFDGAGVADNLRSHSPYRRLDPDVRESLLDAIADRVRTRMGDRIGRHYLAILRAAQRRDSVDITTS